MKKSSEPAKSANVEEPSSKAPSKVEETHEMTSPTKIDDINMLEEDDEFEEFEQEGKVKKKKDV
jgi:hypothetical protein